MTTAAFFDIGDTLGAVRVRPSGDGIDEIAVYPGVRDALAELRAGGVALGIISDRGAIPAADVAPDVPDWRARLRALPVVPLHVAAGAAVPELYAVADSATALQLDDAGFWVDRLGADDAPATSELFLLRADGLTDDAGAAVAFAADGDTARGVLASTAEGLLVAIPAGRSIDFLHLGAARHGHNLKLTAMPALLAEPAAGPPLDVAAAEPPPPPDPDVVELVRAEVTEAGLAETVGRYSGTLPLVAGTTLRSRHIQHPDNAGAVAGLVAGEPDPGEGRSDHHSFQVNGFPACLASEDFFVGPGPGAPTPDPNPNYHSAADATVAGSYVRDICRAVTVAAWLSATR